jgi:hypothetical protein
MNKRKLKYYQTEDLERKKKKNFVSNERKERQELQKK